MLTLKGVMFREVLNCRLKQGKLIGDKRVAMNEVVSVLVITIGLRSVGKIKQCFKIVRLRVIDICEEVYAILILR